MTEQENRTDEQWICMGRRWNGKQLYTLWRRADGIENGYQKLPGIPGGEYSISTGLEDGNRVVWGNPTYVRRADISLDEIAAWRTSDQAAYAEDRQRLLEASAKRTNELDDALKPLLEIAARLKSWGDKDALVRYVTAKVYGA
jgi:hypothetical protein